MRSVFQRVYFLKVHRDTSAHSWRHRVSSDIVHMRLFANAKWSSMLMESPLASLPLVLNMTDKYSNSFSQRHQLSTRQFCSAAGNNLGLVSVRRSWSSEGWCIMWQTGGMALTAWLMSHLLLLRDTPYRNQSHQNEMPVSYLPSFVTTNTFVVIFSKFLNTFRALVEKKLFVQQTKIF